MLKSIFCAAALVLLLPLAALAEPKSTRLAKPEEIELDGNVRREKVSSELGPILLRWPRTVEGLFGRTPLRATVDAARTVSRAIRTASFPSEIQSLNLEWNIVFMDEKMPEQQIPHNLISNCHPGWMTPPSNIYIVAQRVAAGCGGRSSSTSVADAQLTEVLVHEMAHALEFQLLAKGQRFDRLRAEGFATWFETYAASYSSILSAKDLVQRTSTLASTSIKESPDVFLFDGSPYSYSRASMYFKAVENKLGIRGVVELYEIMNNRGLDFIAAIIATTRWNKSQLEKEVSKAAGL